MRDLTRTKGLSLSMFKPRSLVSKLAGRTRLALLAACMLVFAVAVPVFAAQPGSTANNNGDAGANSVTVNKQTGVAVVDVMIASVAVRINVATTITPPLGWTLINRRATTSGDDTALATYWKEADATDANVTTTYTWSGLTAGTRAFAAIARYNDV